MLLLSTIGVHMNYAACDDSKDSEHCIISESATSCCSEEAIDEDCCKTSDIDKEGEHYDFVVNSEYQVVQPAILISRSHLNVSPFIPLSHKYKNQPEISQTKSHQAMLQVFLC